MTNEVDPLTDKEVTKLRRMIQRQDDWDAIARTSDRLKVVIGYVLFFIGAKVAWDAFLRDYIGSLLA